MRTRMTGMTTDTSSCTYVFPQGINGPHHEKICYMNNKGADQPEQPRSLISAFVVRCLDSNEIYSSKLYSSIGTYIQPVSLKASYRYMYKCLSAKFHPAGRNSAAAFERRV